MHDLTQMGTWNAGEKKHDGKATGIGLCDSRQGLSVLGLERDASHRSGECCMGRTVRPSAGGEGEGYSGTLRRFISLAAFA